jgi:hypothetical protein
MGVTYKLKDEVVEFIIGQKQAEPSTSCRQLAESASEKFGLKLSKSSVHDVLKQSGITTPRGRKPKNKFEIPQEKKKQIQVSLSQVNLVPLPEKIVSSPTIPVSLPPPQQVAPVIHEPPQELPPVIEPVVIKEEVYHSVEIPVEDIEVSEEYEGAGKIFYKAVQWDLGILTEGNIKERDWDYYLTYAKGLKVNLENNQNFFIDLPLPIERCVRETADGLINNIRPFVVHHVSDQELFKSCMEALPGFKISDISIVGNNDHILFEFEYIVENKRRFVFKNRLFVENNQKNFLERLKYIFFSQDINLDLINNLLNVKGMDKVSREENVVKLIVEDSYEYKSLLSAAAAKLNEMYLRDEQDRLVKVEI